MDNKTELEKELHKMIHEWRCLEINNTAFLVGKLVELIETEKLFALLQEPPKLHLQGKI